MARNTVTKDETTTTTTKLSTGSLVGAFAASLLALTSAAAKTGLLPANILADGTTELYTNDLLFQDLGAAVVSGILAYGLVKYITRLATTGVLEPRDSRKAIHCLCAPAYILVFPFFSTASLGARVFAATIPLINGVRLYAAAQDDEADANSSADSNNNNNELAAAVSRSGDSAEAIGGPLVYVIIMFVTILAFWRDTPHAVVALSAMAAGDGTADLIGRRFGKSNPWPVALTGPDNRKSVAGSMAFVVSSVLVAWGLLAWLQYAGCLTTLATLSPVELLSRLAVICSISAFMELLPNLDDNYTVPLSAAILSVLLLG